MNNTNDYSRQLFHVTFTVQTIISIRQQATSFREWFIVCIISSMIPVLTHPPRSAYSRCMVLVSHCGNSFIRMIWPGLRFGHWETMIVLVQLFYQVISRKDTYLNRMFVLSSLFLTFLKKSWPYFLYSLCSWRRWRSIHRICS